MDDLFGVHPGRTDYFTPVPASVHEAEVDLQLRVSEPSFRSSLQIARKRIVHVANDSLHVRRGVRTSVSFKSW